MSDYDKVGVETERVARIGCAQCHKILDVKHLPSFSEIRCPGCGTAQIVPAQFGAFLLLTRLGAGGMGVIYHAMDKELGRHVALKVMKRSLGENTEFVKSFKHEAQAAAALNHRNVVQIYSFGQVDGQPYIVMELVNGGRLDEMVSETDLFNESRALEIHLEVAEGLNAASEVGLIHSDIKPANILFGQYGEAKVVDFGLASYVGQQQQQPGQIWGTPYYIAPEKARGKKIDFRSDIYSLGATLFHVLTGEPPFDGPTPTDVVLARLENPAPNLLTIREDLHPETAALVARMLDVEPGMRYPSYPALIIDMRTALDASRLPMKRTGSKSKTKSTIILERAPESTFSPPIIKGVVIGVVALVLAIGSVYGFKTWQTHEAQQAAAESERIALDLAKRRGNDSWQHLNDAPPILLEEYAAPVLKQRTTVDQLLTAMQKANAATKTTPAYRTAEKDISAVAALSDALDKVVKEVADLQSTSRAAYAKLEAATDSRTAVTLADQLDKLSDRLTALTPALRECKDPVVKALAKAQQSHAQLGQALKQAQEQVRLEEDRRKKELETKAREEKELQEKTRRRPLIMQREYDAIEKARGANKSLVAERKFEAAAKAFVGSCGELTLDESKAYAATVTETYTNLAKLMTFIIQGIESAPFVGGWTLGDNARDIVKADSVSIQYSLGTVGSTQVTWEQVPVTQLMRIAGHYAESQKLPELRRAEIATWMALFCYETGVFKTAETYAQTAVQINPALKDDLHRLMPLLLDP